MSIKITKIGNRVRIQTSFDELKHDGDKLGKSVDRTKQSFKDECDINKIVERFPNIELTPENLRNPDLYQEFDSGFDFLAAQAVVERANEQFNTLPSTLRERFKHNPALFLDYVADPKNHDEMLKLGLVKNPVVVNSVEKVQSSVSQPNTVIKPTQSAIIQQAQPVKPVQNPSSP